MGKVIRKELFKRLKSSIADEWYIYNVEDILEYEMHKIIADFEQTTEWKKGEMVDLGRAATYLSLTASNRKQFKMWEVFLYKMKWEVC